MEIIQDRLKKNLQNLCTNYGTFKLSSGRESNYYIDCRKGFGDPIIYGQIKVLLIRALDRFMPQQVGGPAIGAVTLVGMAVNDGYNGFYVRKEPKEYGLGRQIEGMYNPEFETVLVDEIITTGANIRLVMDIINKDKIMALICIVNRSGLDNVDGVPIISIFKEEDLLEDPS